MRKSRRSKKRPGPIRKFWLLHLRNPIKMRRARGFVKYARAMGWID